MSRSLVVLMTLILGVASVGFAAAPQEASPRVTPERAPSAVPALSGILFGELPLEQAIGGVGTAGTCYSDPCPGWGSYEVSCSENGCVAYSDHVWCPSSGDKYCPNPCAENGICNQECTDDPDCCTNGAPCYDDSNCGGPTYGYCETYFAPRGMCVCW